MNVDAAPLLSLLTFSPYHLRGGSYVGMRKK